MILDAKHRKWAFATAGLLAASAAAYVPYHLRSPNGPSGGSWVGLAFGVAAFGLMAFAGLLGLRRRFPAWRVGRPETWMRGHLWLGFLTVPLVFFHGGFQFGGTLTAVLTVLVLLVAVSGVFGLVLQQILPRVMTSRLPMETVYEEIDHVRAQLVAEADALVGAVTGPLGFEAPAELVPPGAAASPRGRTPSGKLTIVEGSAPLKDFYKGQVRPFLNDERRVEALSSGTRASAAFSSVRALLPPDLHEPLRDLEVACEEHRQLEDQARLHRWLHGWVLVHVPLSYALLLLAAVHAVASVRY